MKPHTPSPHHVQLHTDQQAHPPHVLDVRVALRGAAQRGPQTLPFRGHAREEVRRGDDVKHCARGMAHQRVARKRGPVVARRHDLCHRFRHQHRANGQATCEMQVQCSKRSGHARL